MIKAPDCLLRMPSWWCIFSQDLPPTQPTPRPPSSSHPCVRHSHSTGPQTATLKKYQKHYELPALAPNSTKEELASVVGKHWNSVVSIGVCLCGGGGVGDRVSSLHT
jgi:hypothetical protein